MEKRTILAFVLSFLVLISWSYIFGPEKQHQPPQEEQAGTATQAPHQTPAPPQTTPLAPAPAPITPAAPAPSPATQHRDIVVDTPLYRAVLSNAGPTLTSFRLKKYRQTIDPDSAMIELINLQEGMGEFLRVGFTRLSEQIPQIGVCRVEGEDIRLGPDSHPTDLVFHAESADGLTTTYSFRFYPDRYRIDITAQVFNRGGIAVNGSVRAHMKVLEPDSKKGYYSYRGLVLLVDDELEQMKIKKALEDESIEGRITWFGYEDDYFITALVPENTVKGIFKGRLQGSGLLEGTYLPLSEALAPSMQITSRYTLFMGPRQLDTLKSEGMGLDQAIDFGWTDIIAKPLLYVLRFFEKYLHNYGVSIILLTIMVKILFWPLTHKSYKSMGEMKKLQPRMAKIRDKYKHDKQLMNKEIMGLYRTYKVNPASGCLPMVIQIPVFFALFRVLGSAIELRHAPFLFWINDLSAPDRLFNFPFAIPLMSPPYGIPVLTLLMGASMFVQQKMTPTPGDPSQAKIMMFLPVIFTFMFINFPSGLVLYWLVNNVLSIGQQYRIGKKSA